METLIAALLTAALTMGVPSGELPSDAKESNGAEPLTHDVRTTWAEEAIIPVSIVEMVEETQDTEPEMVYAGRMYITGYDPWCGHCCGKAHPDGKTASGVIAQTNHTVAMCKDYPFGTEIYIDGLGYYTVEDRGVGKDWVDVACESHEACYAITRYADVYIVEGAG